MTEETRKRLEEAANKYQEEYETTERVAFTHGAVWGYKEAIAMAKEWLKEHLEDDDNYYNEEELCWIGRDEFLADFESDMAKLWEDEK